MRHGINLLPANTRQATSHSLWFGIQLRQSRAALRDERKATLITENEIQKIKAKKDQFLFQVKAAGDLSAEVRTYYALVEPLILLLPMLFLSINKASSSQLHPCPTKRIKANKSEQRH